METAARKILWADDETELLRPHHLFLNEKGFEVTPVNNGEDAVAMVQQENFDIVLLDEMMPGLDGLQTLEQIKQHNSNIPIIMITKSEEEHLMDEAIGRRIDDYLTKPVNPSQIFMACKKLLDSRHIRQSQAGQVYVSKATLIQQWLAGDVTWKTWIDLHQLLCEWDIEIRRLGDRSLYQMVDDQKRGMQPRVRSLRREQLFGVGGERRELSADVRGRRAGVRLSVPGVGASGLFYRRRFACVSITG